MKTRRVYLTEDNIDTLTIAAGFLRVLSSIPDMALSAIGVDSEVLKATEKDLARLAVRASTSTVAVGDVGRG